MYINLNFKKNHLFYNQFICFFNFLFFGKNTILKEIIIFWQNIFHYWKKKYGCWILNCMNCICYCRCCLLYRHQDGYASYKRPAHVRLCVPRKQRWTQSQYHFHWVCLFQYTYVCKFNYCQPKIFKMQNLIQRMVSYWYMYIYFLACE